MRVNPFDLHQGFALVASEWIDLGTLNPFTNLIHSPNHMFLARQLSPLSRTQAQSEPLEVVKMSFEDALQAVLRGQITHGASCVAILKTQHFLSRRGCR